MAWPRRRNKFRVKLEPRTSILISKKDFINLYRQNEADASSFNTTMAYCNRCGRQHTDLEFRWWGVDIYGIKSWVATCPVTHYSLWLEVGDAPSV